jgi:hypothetical protein
MKDIIPGMRSGGKRQGCAEPIDERPFVAEADANGAADADRLAIGRDGANPVDGVPTRDRLDTGSRQCNHGAE